MTEVVSFDRLLEQSRLDLIDTAAEWEHSSTDSELAELVDAYQARVGERYLEMGSNHFSLMVLGADSLRVNMGAAADTALESATAIAEGDEAVNRVNETMREMAFNFRQGVRALMELDALEPLSESETEPNQPDQFGLS